MNPEILKLVDEQLKTLPDDIKNLVLHGNVDQQLAEISKKYALHFDQAAILENETTLVLVGLVTSKDYLAHLIKELRISREMAVAIVNDVNKKIFSDIRASLQKMGEEIDRDEDTQQEEIRHVSEDELNKENVLRGIEEPVKSASFARKEYAQAQMMPKRSGSNLYDLANKMQNRDLQTVTDAKRMDDFRRDEMVAKMAKTSPQSEVKAPIEPVIKDKLTEVVKAPKQNIEVKLPEEAPKAPSGPDPYREAI